MKRTKFYVWTIIFSCISFYGNAQKMVRGLVVDSLTLEHLPGTTVKVKNENRGTVSDAGGVFALRVSPGDTLIFTSIGYKRSVIQVPIQPEEDIMFVRMREESFLLQEIVVRDKSLKFLPDKIHSHTLSSTKPLKAGDVGGALGAGVNFAYFTKQERDKRKLVSMLQEMERIRAYKEIIYDPSFKWEVMEKYAISESRYFELLALFNQGYQNVIRSGNEQIILYNLHYYFDHADDK